MAEEETESGSKALAKLGIAALTNLIIASVVMIVWMYIRPKYPRVYQPRMYHSKFKCKPEAPDSSWFGWFGPTYRYPIKDIGLHIGPDQYVFLRVMHFSVILFAALSIYNLCVVLPINCIGDAPGVEGLDILSMSNIEEKSDYLYAHMVAVMISFVIFAKFMISLWNDMIDVRCKWLEQNVQSDVMSVLLLDIPKELDTEEALKNTFDELFPTQIKSAILARDFAKEDQVLCERDQAFEKLRKATLGYEYKKKKKPDKAERPLFRKGGMICCGGEKVDAINHFKELLAEKNQELESIRSKKPVDFKSVGAGFVMFESAGSATCAVQTLIFRNDLPIVIPNVAPAQVYWPNLKMKLTERKIRTMLGRIAMGNIIFWFAIPAAFIQGLANLEKMADEYSWMESAKDIPPPINGWIEDLAPPVLTVVLFMLVPPVCKLLCRLQGLPTIPKVDRGAFMKMFFFSIFFVFVFQLIGGSLVSEVSRYIDSPGDIPDELGKAIPANATYFINFILLLGLLGPTLQLLLIVPLAKFLFMKRVMDMLGIRMDDQEEPPLVAFNHVARPPKVLSALLLTLIFSSINPAVLPIGMLSISIQYFVNKHQFMYVFGQEYQSGGLFWPKYSQQLMGTFLVYVLTMILILAVKKSPIAAGVSVINLVGLYCLNVYLKTYERAYMNLSLSAARGIDKESRSKSEEFKRELTEIRQYRNSAYISETKEFDTDISRFNSQDPLTQQPQTEPLALEEVEINSANTEGKLNNKGEPEYDNANKV